MDGDDGDLGAAATARTAQILAAVAMLAENTARLRAQRTHDRAARDAQAAAGIRTRRSAEHATARTVYGAALHPRWAAGAGTVDAARVWGAAGGWTGTDPDAAQACLAAEQQLRRLHPQAMVRYDTLRTGGAGPVEAMRAAAPLFIATPQTTAALPTAASLRAEALAADEAALTDRKVAAAAAATELRQCAESTAARAGSPPGRTAPGYPGVAQASAPIEACPPYRPATAATTWRRVR